MANNPEKELLATARKVASLMGKRRRLKKLLKEVDAELRHERKFLKGLATATRHQSIPSRAFGDGVGYAVPDMRPTRKPMSLETSEFVEGLSEDEEKKK